MTVKELFDKAENGTLTWEQFQTAMGESKFVDLTEGNYVSKQKYDNELSTLNSRITELNTTIGSRDSDLATLQQKLKDAGDIEALKNASQELTKLQAKYDKEMKDYESRLSEQAYDFAVEKFAEEFSFSSKAAKRDFTQTMKAKKFSLEDGKLIGAKDYANDIYFKENPDALVTKSDPEPKPEFVGSTQPKSNNKPSLSELMKMKNANPELNIDI